MCPAAVVSSTVSMSSSSSLTVGSRCVCVEALLELLFRRTRRLLLWTSDVWNCAWPNDRLGCRSLHQSRQCSQPFLTSCTNIFRGSQTCSFCHRVLGNLEHLSKKACFRTYRKNFVKINCSYSFSHVVALTNIAERCWKLCFNIFENARVLIIFETLALYKSFTYLLTYASLIILHPVYLIIEWRIQEVFWKSNVYSTNKSLGKN